MLELIEKQEHFLTENFNKLLNDHPFLSCNFSYVWRKFQTVGIFKTRCRDVDQQVGGHVQQHQLLVKKLPSISASCSHRRNVYRSTGSEGGGMIMRQPKSLESGWPPGSWWCSVPSGGFCDPCGGLSMSFDFVPPDSGSSDPPVRFPCR